MHRLKMKVFQLTLSIILLSKFIVGEVQLCSNSLSVPLKLYTMQADHSIVLKDGTTYKLGTYWKSKNGTYYGCPCMTKQCIRRCPDAMFGRTNETNQNGLQNEFTNLTIWQDAYSKQVNAHLHFQILNKEPCDVDSAIQLDPANYSADQYRILHNGSIHFTHEDVHPKNAIINIDAYCIFKDDLGTVQVLTCATEEQIPGKAFHHYMYPIFLLISVVFLLFTLLAYVLASEMRKVHGSSMACHSASMAVGFLGLAIIQIVGQDISTPSCISIAFITYYFLLATFFWLHVMCFDIWWAFSGFAKLTGSVGQQSKKKFILYSLYAWSMPTILFTITLSIELGSNIQEDHKPGIGVMRCWFQAKLPEFLYFNGPVSIILLMNLYFFISTTVKLFRLKKETAMLKRGDSRKHNTNEESDEKQRFKLYLKLFLVMGLSWITEILSHAIGGPEQIWYLTDSINTLQGVFIFVLCVWTTKVRDVVIRRLCPKFAQNLSIQPNKSETKSSEVSESATAPIATSLKQLKDSEDQEGQF